MSWMLLACGASSEVAFPAQAEDDTAGDAVPSERSDAQPLAGEIAAEGDSGTACSTDADCEGRCVHGVCTLPEIDDGLLSPALGETDVDCGGAFAALCADGLRCESDADCASGVCGADARCASAPSCRGALGQAGISTCGSGESGAAGAAHESCCRTLPLPDRPDRSLDRYEITSGRVRAFVEALSQLHGGEPNVRRFAKEFAAAHPDSQLADVARDFPGYLDILPAVAQASVPGSLPMHLGARVIDAINAYDGCYIRDGAYGHPTYWQEPAVLSAYGQGATINGQSGQRYYTREQLDEKPINCAMPLFLAAFCAWDGGELARIDDYWEVWGRRPVQVGTQTVYIPWESLLPWGEFNWHNGRGAACLSGWPGCENAQYRRFYTFPELNFNPANDESPLIAAPGRFSRDVTAIRSANGEGWLDIGGNFLEAAWGVHTSVTNNTDMVCDMTAGAGVGANHCSRTFTINNQQQVRNGTLRYRGPVPGMDLVGYSYEGHSRSAESILRTEPFMEPPQGSRPLHFQYGKVTGRCARASR